MRKASKRTWVELKGDGRERGTERVKGDRQVWTKLQVTKEGNVRYRNVRRWTTNDGWETITNFCEDYFEITPDVVLDRSSYVLILGLRLLNSKWCFLKTLLRCNTEFMECGRGDNRCPGKIIITWIRWLRNPCSEYHLYGKHSGHCIIATYICVIYDLKGVTHIDNFLWFTQSSEVDIRVPILKVSKWRPNDLSKIVYLGLSSKLLVLSWIFSALKSWLFIYAKPLSMQETLLVNLFYFRAPPKCVCMYAPFLPTFFPI